VRTSVAVGGEDVSSPAQERRSPGSGQSMITSPSPPPDGVNQRAGRASTPGGPARGRSLHDGDHLTRGGQTNSPNTTGAAAASGWAGRGSQPRGTSARQARARAAGATGERSPRPRRAEHLPAPPIRRPGHEPRAAKRVGGRRLLAHDAVVVVGVPGTQSRCRGGRARSRAPSCFACITGVGVLGESASLSAMARSLPVVAVCRRAMPVDAANTATTWSGWRPTAVVTCGRWPARCPTGRRADSPSS
jgi:hypothetical protein